MDNFVALIAKPCSALNPSGLAVRENHNSTQKYYNLKDARNLARTIERKIQDGEEEVKPKEQWEFVVEQAKYFLENETKDLEIAVWLTEGLLRLQGFLGLALGFATIRVLVDTFSDTLHPLPDDDGLETTLAALAGLNGFDNEGSLIRPIREQLITQSNNEASYALWQYQQVLKKPTDLLKAIETAAKETDVKFYQDLTSDLAKAQIEFDALQASLNKQYGTNAPPSSRIKNSLTEFSDNLRVLFQATQINIALNDPIATQEITNNLMPQLNHNITHREHALAQLTHIAAFFKATEPHSPLSYAILRLIKWGNLSLPELMQELITDSTARRGFANLTGVPTEE